MLNTVNHFVKGKIFFSGENSPINGNITVQDLNRIILALSDKYKGMDISVDNAHALMKEVFQEIDLLSSTIKETNRKEIALDLILNIISRHRGSEAKVFADSALKLYIEYSLDSIAYETLQNKGGDQQFSDRSFSRPKSKSLEYPNLFDLDRYFYPDVNQDDICLPRSEVSDALSNVAASNLEAINNQVEEVTQYIREASIEVDEKIALFQEELQHLMTQTQESVDGVQKRIQLYLEKSKLIAEDAQDQLAAVIQQVANEYVQKLKEKKIVTERESLPKKADQSVNLSIQDIIANSKI